MAASFSFSFCRPMAVSFFTSTDDGIIHAAHQCSFMPSDDDGIINVAARWQHHSLFLSAARWRHHSSHHPTKISSMLLFFWLSGVMDQKFVYKCSCVLDFFLFWLAARTARCPQDYAARGFASRTRSAAARCRKNNYARSGVKLEFDGFDLGQKTRYRIRSAITSRNRSVSD